MVNNIFANRDIYNHIMSFVNRDEEIKCVYIKQIFSKLKYVSLLFC
jgi:hypothetical protein